MLARVCFFILFFIAMPGAQAHEHLVKSDIPRATYLGNEGVLVTNGDTKILFDAFYSSSYGQYALVPEDMAAAIMAGEAPFDGIDAVFVSHAHGDHFTPAPMLAYLRAHEGLRLYAPKQALDRLTEEAGADDPVLSRVTPVDLGLNDAPVSMTVGDLIIEAVAVPHAGGARMASIQNIVFRVTLNGETTAAHFGDAGPVDANFAPHQDHWDARITHIAFPPYWFHANPEGRAILSDRIKARKVVGVHVPAEAAGNGDAARERVGGDVFTDPGETRDIPVISEN
jgi:L-ascorbate metabolism protein UlaG (beta-lactamase superfamily)